MTDFKEFYCPHGGTERTLANGRPLAQGQYFKLGPKEMKDPHNVRLIEEGHILEVSETKADAEAKEKKS